MQCTRLGSVTLLALAALGAACAESQGEDGGAAPASAAEEIPSLEEAQQRAAAEIDAENADDELERLKREIAEDG